VQERLALLLILVTAMTFAVLATRAWNRHRVQSLIHEAEPASSWDRLGHASDGRRALVAFSTPSCAACHTAQAPAISAVEAQLGPSTLRVINVDTARQPEVARAFGVLTVPSTMVLAPTGQVVAVNQGFAPSRRLVEQLQRV